MFCDIFEEYSVFVEILSFVVNVVYTNFNPSRKSYVSSSAYWKSVRMEVRYANKKNKLYIYNFSVLIVCVEGK